MKRLGLLSLTFATALLTISCVLSSDASRGAPAVSTISPSSVAAGSSSFPVTVTGSNFGLWSTMLVNGSPRATVYINQTTLTGTVLGSDVQQSGTLQVTVSNGKGTSSNSNSIPLAVTTPQPLQVVTSSLPAGTVQSPYSASVALSGGLAPYRWAVSSGQLPPGIVLDASTGLVTGVPGQAGNFGFTAKVTDSSPTPQSASKALQISVQTVSPLSMSASVLPAGTVGVAYSASVSATGGLVPYAFSISSGALPSGLNLNAATGAISGTPTQSGGFSFSVRVTDAESLAQSAANSFSITVAATPLRVNTSSLPNGQVQSAYSAALSASGGTAPYIWNISSGSLPAGLSFTATSGAISGTPTAAGPSSFTVQVRDSAATPQTAMQALTITVSPLPLQITTGNLAAGQAQVAYSATLAASGGTAPYSWSLTSGSLPTGLNLNASTAAINGTPTASGSFSFTVQAKDSAASAQTATKSLSINIAAAPAAPAPLQVTTSGLPGGQVQSAYSATLAASGGTAPYSWSLASGSLPAGLSLNAATGVISGTPTATGGFSFTVQAKDSAASAQTATKSFSISISAMSAPTIGSISPSSGPTAGGTLVTINGTNFQTGATVNFGASASPNVLVSSATQIQATAPAGAAGLVSVQVRNPDGQSATLAGAFSYGTGLQIVTPALPNAQLNVPYSATLSATGGVAPYNWSYSGTVPHCVDFLPAGQFSGTPCVPGNYTFTTIISDASGATSAKQFSITVAVPPLAITTTSLPSASQAATYLTTLQATGGTPSYAWSIASGQLPAGLTLDPAAGTISGTPSVNGSFPLTVQVSDAAGATTSAALTLTVTSPGALKIVSSVLPDAFASSPYSTALQATGGTPAYTWSINSGALPSGVSLLAATGQLTGTPGAQGQFTFTVKVTDSASPTGSATQSFTLTVNQPSLTDQYGGWTSLKSPAGATNAWRVEKFGKRWMFVTPDGNAYWANAPFAVQPTGNAQTKYGSLAAWGGAQVARLVDYGFNGLGDYPYPAATADSLPTTARRLPQFHTFKFSQNVVTNRVTLTGQQPAPDAVKSLMDCQDFTSGYTGWRAHQPDVFDPNFDAFVNNYMVALKADVFGEGSLLSSKWIIGLSTDDTDDLFGSGAGLDAPVGDTSIHPHLGWLSLAARPTLVTSPSFGITYKNSTVYSKQQVVAFLKTRYATIAALNSAWGSNYTTFDSAGGWSSGTGLTDENGSHTAWLGTTDGTLAGASAAVKTDLDAFLYLWATQYFKAVTSRVRQYAPGFLVMSPVASNWHGGASRAPWLKAAAENCDVLNVMLWTQQVLDLTAAAAGDKPIIPWEGNIANPDSPYGPPNIGMSGIGKWDTQAQRGAFYATRMTFLGTATVTATGNQPVVGNKFWSWIDHDGEQTNWGVTTTSDNPYCGAAAGCANTSSGEKANYGDFVNSVRSANNAALLAVCQALGGCK